MIKLIICLQKSEHNTRIEYYSTPLPFEEKIKEKVRKLRQ